MSAPRSSFLRSDPSDRHGYSNPSSPGLPGDRDGNETAGGGGLGGDSYYNPKPTFATFSPVTSLSGAKASTTSAAKHRSTILVHQKSPLLLATPPQITRSLAYSHPFLLPLNKLAGLISWTTGDPWESFILVLVWWLTVLYGDTIIRFAGPIVLVLTLIAGMYGRKYSPLSTSGWSNDDDVVSTSAGSASRSSGTSNTVTTGSGLGYFFFGLGAGSTNNKDGKAGAKTTGSEAVSGKARSRAKNHSIDSMAGKGEAGGGAAGGGGSSAHQRTVSEVATTTRHQKTLDEIVETLREFTARCNLLLEPLLELTDFLSTQSTPTSATTRPALTVLFVRILLCTPFWFLLTLPPLRVITTRRVALVFGTLILTWHSRVMRVSRTILWRSATIRRLAALVTGLEFEGPMRPSKSPSYVTAGGSTLADPSTTPATAAAALQSKLSSTKPARRMSTPRESELTRAIRRARAGQDAGVRFTFILYENQRRWVGLGWTTSLFSYERPSWTDEHNNTVPTKDEFELPEVEDGSKMQWRWVEGSRWRVDGVVDEAVRVEKTTSDGEHVDTWDYDGEGGRMGWVYYDNKWQNGRRGADGWNRWTRRRKWFRDAELVEVDFEEEDVSAASVSAHGDGNSLHTAAPARAGSPSPSQSGTVGTFATSSTAPTSGSSDALGPFPGGSTNGTAYTGGDASSVTSGGGGGGGGGSIFSFGGGSNNTTNYDGVTSDAGDNADTASIMSTSSRSRFLPPTLRRRVTDTSTRGAAAPAITTNTIATAHPSNGVTPITISAHSRRNSEAEEEADMISSSVGVKPHLNGNASGGQGGWGYGDEAYMGLD